MFLLQAITGLQHVQVVSLIAKTGKDKRKEKAYLIMNTIPLDQTSIRPDGLQVGVIMVVSAIGEVLRARGETGACLRLVEELVPFFNDRCSLSFMDSDRRGDGVPLELE